MSKKIVGVDMDDTICHLVKMIVGDHNKTYPSHVFRYEQVLSWDIDHLVHPDCQAELLFLRPGLYEELAVLDEFVIEELRRIHDAYDLIVITAASPSTVLEKWNWMQKHVPFIPYENFMTLKRKDLVNVDLLIDDATHNIVPFAATGRPVIGIRHPWNSSIQQQYTFVDGWKGMKERVDSILEEGRIVDRESVGEMRRAEEAENMV